MIIEGLWYLCDDGIVRAVIRGEIETNDGRWLEVPFLVDTGADRTVLSADNWVAAGLPPASSGEQLAGVGGRAAFVAIDTRIRFKCDTGKVVFQGRYAAVTDLESLDMSVLGRDILNLFAVIVDRPRDRVCLLGQKHQYTISFVP